MSRRDNVSTQGAAVKPRVFGMSQRRRKQMIFYIALIGLPFIQFLIMYVGVNISSIVLAFRSYSVTDNTYAFVGLENFVNVIKDFLGTPYMANSLKNSAILYILTLLCMPLGLFFSYYIYKKLKLSGLCRVILYIPHMVSSLIIVLIYKYFVDRAVPQLVNDLLGKDIFGLLANLDTRMETIIFFYIWNGFGNSILLYVGSMNNISKDVEEAAAIDGASPLKEFIHVTIPAVYPTFVVFVVSGIALFFTNQINLYSFYGSEVEYSYYTIGYYLFRMTKMGSINDYTYLSAMSIIMTFIAVPVAYTAKRMLEKYGPTPN